MRGPRFTDLKTDLTGRGPCFDMGKFRNVRQGADTWGNTVQSTLDCVFVVNMDLSTITSARMHFQNQKWRGTTLLLVLLLL